VLLFKPFVKPPRTIEFFWREQVPLVRLGSPASSFKTNRVPLFITLRVGAVSVRILLLQLDGGKNT
jgi:hypothetical protein